MQALFGQRLPAADDLGRVIHFELVVLVLQHVLKATADGAFLDGEYQHLVIGEQAALNGLGKVDDEQLFAVQRLIIHRAQGDFAGFSLDLGAVTVDAWRSGHVQAFGRADVVAIMNAHEVAFVIVAKGGAGSAVRFVADHQIKSGQAMVCLGTADHVDGVIGGEHHAHVLGIVALEHFHREAIRLGGGRITQLVSEHLNRVILCLALLAYVAVGADGKAVERRCAFLRPLGKGLRQQRQAGHQEQYALALASQLLSDLQAGEGLASATSHNQLATLGVLEAGRHGVQCRLLVIAQLLARLKHHRLVGLVFGPVDLAVFQSLQVDLADRRLLALQGVLGVLTPVVGGGHDDAVRERRLARGSEETVDVLFLDFVVLGVQLALNRVVLAGALGARHQVDTCVLAAEALLLGPLCVHPHLVVQITVGGLIAQVGADQLLEVGAFFAFSD